MALAGGCGKGEDAGPRQPAPEAPVSIDTAAETLPTQEPVPLPTDFPADFPIPPGAVVTRAEVAPDETGTAASATLVTTDDADDTLEWYERALADAGWEVTERGQRSIHAVLGESWTEVRVSVAEPGRTVVEARAWKAGR